MVPFWPRMIVPLTPEEAVICTISQLRPGPVGFPMRRKVGTCSVKLAGEFPSDAVHGTTDPSSRSGASVTVAPLAAAVAFGSADALISAASAAATAAAVSPVCCAY